MKQGSSDGSFMNEQQANPNCAASPKQPQQFKALFLKNLRLQSKQIGTNICQILTPILCILFTYLMKTIAEQNMPAGAIFEPLYYPIKFNDYAQFDELNNFTRKNLKWASYDCTSQKCDQNLLGFNNGTQYSGLLGQIPHDDYDAYHPNVKNQQEQIFVTNPFFLPTQNSTVNSFLYKRLETLIDLDHETIRHFGLDILPDGAYTFNVLNQTNLDFDIKVNDVRDLNLHRRNGLSKIGIYQTPVEYPDNEIMVSSYCSYTGVLELAHMITESFIKSSTNKTLTSGYTFMPDIEGGVTFIDTLINFVAILIFPVSLSLLFPVFLYTVVLEKQEKLIQMMKMNGMKISSYWSVYFVFNLILSVITNAVFVLFGTLLTGMRFFKETNPGLMFFTLFGWSLAQIGMAVFFQTFLNRARSANIIGYLISIWTSMIGSTLSIGIYQFPRQMPVGCIMFAPFAFTRIIYYMLTVCSEGRCYSSLQGIPDEMKQCIVSLYVNFIVFFLLGTYLFQIVPQEFGVTRSPLFPFKAIARLFSKRDPHTLYEIEEDPQLKQYIAKDEEDEFSKRERSDLLSNKKVIEQNPLVINNLRKLYKKQGREGMYPAVRSFNLKVGPKETFGLLGPNGAGKTTLISMITGMFQPNYGNAWIGGYDIRTNVAKAQLQMGVCPQFDLLWPQLTVEEHLNFYARLKGIPSSVIKNKVKKALDEVKLQKFKKFKSSQLSGGMKRRLSVAISLVGDPQIVFLDEPSTGLDPENRRQLWQVLSKCQKQRAIFITTHMMEEADALCNRVGIITSGVLRTVAPQIALKKAYGGGYRVTVSTVKEQRKLVNRQSLKLTGKQNRLEEYDDNYDPHEDEYLKRSIDSFVQTQQKQNKKLAQARVREVTRFMQQNFKGTVLFKQFNGHLMYKVPLDYKVSDIFKTIETMEKQLQVVDVAVTNSSLEDVFMNVVKEHEIGKNPLNSNNDQDQFVSFTNENEEIHLEGNDPKERGVKQSSLILRKDPSVMSDELLQSRAMKIEKKSEDDE